MKIFSKIKEDLKLHDKGAPFKLKEILQCEEDPIVYVRRMDYKYFEYLNDVKKALRIRNISDIKRKNSPLLRHRDSVEIDTGKLDKSAMLAKMSKHVEKMLKKKYDNWTRD